MKDKISYHHFYKYLCYHAKNDPITLLLPQCNTFHPIWFSMNKRMATQAEAAISMPCTSLVSYCMCGQTQPASAGGSTLASPPWMPDELFLAGIGGCHQTEFNLLRSGVVLKIWMNYF